MLWDVGLIVRWPMPQGEEVYEEKTFTISVNKHGARLLLAAGVEKGQSLFLKNPATGNEIESKVVQVGAPHGGNILVAVEFVEPSEEFWPFRHKR